MKYVWKTTSILSFKVINKRLSICIIKYVIEKRRLLQHICCAEQLVVFHLIHEALLSFYLQIYGVYVLPQGKIRLFTLLLKTKCSVYHLKALQAYLIWKTITFHYLQIKIVCTKHCNYNNLAHTCTEVQVINILGMQASNKGFMVDFSAKHVLQILSNFMLFVIIYF